jgi:predicted 3-demethylubiquinone-9 3-methyltransferase (glyoxalase superfamily)
MSDAVQRVTPFLMFEGRAAEAMDFYVSVFGDARIEWVKRYGPEGPGPEGSVLQAAFSIGGQRFLCIDSFVHHAFTFTPALSLHVVCADDEEIDARFARLAEGGAVLMALAEYPFSRRYGWLQDRFGVSWQLSVPDA